jgi:hypothetical protein
MKRYQQLILLFIITIFFIRYVLIDFYYRYLKSSVVVVSEESASEMKMNIKEDITPDNEDRLSSTLTFPDTFACDDPTIASTTVWCNIQPPSSSLFRFKNPPKSGKRWKLAQEYAIQKKPILLEKILKSGVFANEKNFLDGDVWFRKYHELSDYYFDENYNFDILNYPPSFSSKSDGNNRELSLAASAMASSTSSTSAVSSGGLSSTPIAYSKKKEKDQVFHTNIDKMLKSHSHISYDYEKKGYNRNDILPSLYSFYGINRIPIFHLGYFVFPRKSTQHFFKGHHDGEVIIDRAKLFNLWKEAKNHIQFPWIGFHSANENWGIFSTYFPNRTVDWGSCCYPPKLASNRQLDSTLFEMLNHSKTILFLTNQHHNITHPRLITMPRGIPIQNAGVDKLLWDSMHNIVKTNGKDNLLFTSSSNWGYRPKIIDCIHNKFLNEPSVKWNKYNEKLSGRLTPEQYYIALGKSLFSLALPGLGYDTFR